MSAPITELLGGAVGIGVPVAVIGASLLGSAHCVGMCGGLVVATCRTRADWVQYQGGRLLAYAALGAGAGALSERVFSASALGWAQWLAAGAMAVGFFAMAARAWRGETPHFSWVPTRWISRGFAATRGAALAPLGVGLLSAILPCGWLQSFVLAAAATRTAGGGALLLACFWLGTLPALSAAPWLARGALRPAARRAPRLTAVLLVAAGVLGLGIKMRPLIASESTPHCHCEDAKESGGAR